jgi:hypothetical protein
MADSVVDTLQNPSALNLAPQIEDVLRNRLPGILAGLTHKINVGQLLASSGTIADIEIDKIVVGSATIGQLTLQGLALDIQSGSAFLQNVRTVLQLQCTLNWSYDIGIASDSGSDSLGSLSFPINIGNLQVPSLNNIPLSIPTFAASNISATIPPIAALDLGGGSFSGVTATNAALPTNGFQLTGLGLGSVSVSNVQVPNASVSKVSIQQFKPNANVVVPSVEVDQIHLPSAHASDIQTAAPIGFDAVAAARGISANFGIFSLTLSVTPIAHINIGSLLLQGVSISGSVSKASVSNIGIPVDVRGINLKTITIEQIQVDNVTV